MTTNTGTTEINLYLVGGAVRDYLMGKTPKDFDFSAEAESFDALRDWLVKNEFEIFLETPQYLTIRARRKKPWWFADFEMTGMTFDFVLCRKDGAYSDGRRPDEVESGTIYDDLARRDFTMNAIAIDANGGILDPHGGQVDIERGRIRCVGGVERLYEDGLRMLRALRFGVQLGFTLGPEETEALMDPDNMQYLANVSMDRIRAELTKCFQIDVLDTLWFLNQFQNIARIVFQDTELWLKPTTEKR